MLTLTNRIDMRPGAVPLVIHLGQYDSDFSLVFELYSSAGNFTVESGTTAMIRGTKTDGNAYDADATINISAKTVTVAGSEQMTAAKGRNVYELVLKKGTKVLSTANFILDVERAAMDADTIASESVLKELNAIIAGAETATQAASNAASAADRAEDAAESVSSASAQIATNTNDISDLKADLSDLSNDLKSAINVIKEVDSGNDFSVNVLSGYWDSSDGTKKNYVTSLGCTEKFVVSENEKLNVVNQFSTTVSFLFWDKSGTYIGYTNVYSGIGGATTTPDNASYCALNYQLSEGVSAITIHGETYFQAETKECTDKVDAVISKTNLFNGIVHSGIRSQTNGKYYGHATADDSYFYTDLIPVDGITKLYMLSDFKYTRQLYVTFFNELKIIIGKANSAFQILESSDFPTGTKYFVVTTNLTEKDTLMIYTGIPDEYISYNAHKVDSYNNIQKKYRRIDRGVVTDRYPSEASNHPVYPLLKGNDLACSYLIDLTGVSKLSYINLAGYKNLKYVDASGKIMSEDVGISANTKGTLTVPSGAVACIYYTGTSGDPSTQFTLVAGETIPERIYGFDEIEIDGLKLDDDYLSGKKIVFDGDSITEAAGVTDITTGIAPNNNKGWGYWVQQNHPGAIVYGYGKSGWTVGKRSGYDDSLLNHISQYPNDVDLFVLSGGYNDQARQMAMGDIVSVTDGSNSYFNATFDQYTFCGALEYWFQQLRTNYPFAQIVYIITPKRIYSSDPIFNDDTKGARVKDVLYSTGQQRMELFWQKIRDVCDKWAIKYLDFSKTSGVVGTGELTDPGLTIGGRYFSLSNGVPDFTHPNTNYYKKLLVPQVENLIRSVIY